MVNFLEHLDENTLDILEHMERYCEEKVRSQITRTSESLPLSSFLESELNSDNNEAGAIMFKKIDDIKLALPQLCKKDQSMAIENLWKEVYEHFEQKE